ncbi:hypothetical protein EYR40_008352 [Pleurotus pulmonarius]|nr:hypothetical protein EYR40_008352 [Pleurotus pulmonarius]
MFLRYPTRWLEIVIPTATAPSYSVMTHLLRIFLITGNGCGPTRRNMNSEPTRALGNIYDGSHLRLSGNVTESILGTQLDYLFLPTRAYFDVKCAEATDDVILHIFLAAQAMYRISPGLYKDGWTTRSLFTTLPQTIPTNYPHKLFSPTMGPAYSMLTMKSLFTLAAVVVAASSVHARADQLEKRAEVNETDILNFALTLEHLENAFYTGGLAKYNESAFSAAGLVHTARDYLVQVGEHEKQHVQFLTTALGSKATQPCNYSFPYTDAKSFAALSQMLEGVGVSAYTGAASQLTTKEYITAAASILATEARHSALVSQAINNFTPWSGAFDVPLGINQVYSLAAAFITSCPSSNPPLPVKAFPSLNVTTSNPKPGSNITLQFNSTSTTNGSSELYMVFYTGLNKEFAKISNKTVTIPADLRGTVYGLVAKNATNVTDSNIIAGPAILLFNFDAAGNVTSV